MASLDREQERAQDGAPEVDPAFSLSNERTFLAWVRTALVLIAGGVVAAKSINFNHEVWRWVVAAPPLLAGAAVAIHAPIRWRTYEAAMSSGRRLPVGRGLVSAGVALGVYALVTLIVMFVDG
jgi:putative membrane protein